MLGNTKTYPVVRIRASTNILMVHALIQSLLQGGTIQVCEQALQLMSQEKGGRGGVIVLMASISGTVDTYSRATFTPSQCTLKDSCVYNSYRLISVQSAVYIVCFSGQQPDHWGPVYCVLLFQDCGLIVGGLYIVCCCFRIVA